MDRLKILKSERTIIRRAFTKISNELDKSLLSKESKDLVTIKAEYNKLQDKASRLFKLDDDVKEVLYSDNSVNEEDIDTEFENVESYRDILSSIQAKYDHVMAEVSPRSGMSLVSQESVDGQVGLTYKKFLNLPKIQLNQFDGDVKNWIGFWGQYKKIHEDANIEPEDKFQYLIQSLKLGSSARELVESFPPSDKNYEKAVKQLKSRFGRDEFLIEVYVREMLSLVLQQATLSTKLSLCKLYDKLETQLRALETLGVTSDKYASMLYPLVESSLPDETLRAWERYRSSNRLSESDTLTSDGKVKTCLQELLNFVQTEVESEERLALARSSFTTTTRGDNNRPSSNQRHRNKAAIYQQEPHQSLPTAATLLSTGNDIGKKAMSISNCLFCSKGGHNIQDCSAFQSLTLQERNEHVSKKGCCFVCLKPGHTVKGCKVFVKCLFCGKRHYGIMCKELELRKQENNTAPSESCSKPKSKSEVLSNFETSSEETLLQTLLVKVTDDKGKDYLARVLLDSGSQRSYITKDSVVKLGLKEIGSEIINHSLFGGLNIKQTSHKNYLVTLQNMNTSFKISVLLTDQEVICNYVPRLKSRQFFSILKEKNIVLTDIGENVPEVKILLGADVLADLFTGAVEKIDDKLVAMETYLGWTMMGKQPCRKSQNSTLLSLFCLDKTEIADLWSLEAIGIRDPVEVKQRDSMDTEVVQHFKKNIKKNVENRYEVCLPWLEGHPELLDNRNVVERRLMSTTRRLRTLNKFKDYDNVFQEWLDLGIIERVSETADPAPVHYLPHHAVIKESSLTTKVRPVFDASAKDKRGHSLNECLAKGPNLVEFIPSLVMKFRKSQIGVTADIKKAFLQISVCSRDRDYLRFLWWEDYAAKKLTTFRHCRVVFGISSSPFLLGATINHHLENAPLQLQETAVKLKEAFYVDNCITSVDSVAELKKFVTEASELMNLGQFELREWASSYSNDSQIFGESFSRETVVPLLGMLWDREKDELYCDIKSISMQTKAVTKRNLLSVAQRVFDVVGFTCPVSLLPKLLLQEVWMRKLTWDEQLPNDIADKFSRWVENIFWLERCRIPRIMSPLSKLSSDTTSIHVFCDASQLAYAACVFIRTECLDEVAVQMIYAKSRISPKNTTIPRLELLAALIGSRMYMLVRETLKLSCKSYFWTDSSIVLTWIKEKEDWGTFVGNRCREICTTTNKEEWHHIPGDSNPADLPSRGCGAKTLFETKWWEGPAWLRKDESQWPMSDPPADSSAFTEKKKAVISAVVTDEEWNFTNSLLYFSSYLQLLRMVAWMLRFLHNSNPTLISTCGSLSMDEIQRAEERVIWCIQQESFGSKIHNHKNLPVFVDAKGLLRVKTRLVLSKDCEDYKFPILLPSSHSIVTLIVMEQHIVHQHAGIQSMLVIIREKFWIQKGRKTIKGVLSRCVRCKKFNSKAAKVPVAPLPLERIINCNAFQSTGIDLAGPLYLRNGDKSWVILFTCAVYRAIHLELVQSLSTESFMAALRRFISRRGRISLIYTDNGTNFTGMNNLLKQLDWKTIEEKFQIHQITWKFNPPSAPWWGGMWERLVRMVKELLRRNLGLARVDYEELMTLLCDFESTINSRPLTYISDDYDILQPLTPSMFLQPIVKSDVQDLDIIDSNTLNKRVRYMQKLRTSLRSRFKKEYLAMLVHRSKGKPVERCTINPGDIVLIGDDNIKRINWPLALVMETIPGKDGVCRVAKLKTAKGELIRPVQRLYPMEVNSKETVEIKGNESTQKEEEALTGPETINLAEEPESTKPDVNLPKETRRGRKVKTPKILDL